MKTLFSFFLLFNLFVTLHAQNYWQQSNGPYGGYIFSLAINSTGNIFAGYLGNGVYRSTDGGFTWNEENIGTTSNLQDVFFTSPTKGFTVGLSTILHSTQITDVNEQPAQPGEFRLDQNFPNPFNPTTSIQYEIGSRQFVQLKIYDVLGTEITTLVNEEKTSGTYKVEFNPVSSIRHSASGIYFYQLKAGDYLETKKWFL